MAVTAAAAAPAETPATRLRRIGADALYVLLGLVSSIVAFGVWVAGVTVTLTLCLLIVGLPVALATFAVFRGVADLERRRAALVVGRPLAGEYRTAADRRVTARLRVAVRDPQRWKDLVYLVLFSVIGFCWGTVWLVLWGVALGSLTLPAWWWAMPSDATYMTMTIDTWQESLGAAAIGVALLPCALFLQRGLALSQAGLARRLLGPSLSARVERLTETRAGAVDAAAVELQRIERDLHDGAQARLVALAMDLGMADERFDRDPEGARALVGEAREEARRALAELRDLARGMRPSLLTERGLAAAVAALAARSPLPATATVDVPEQLPPAVETAAWFVVSEALANAAKHSGGRRVAVQVIQRAAGLHVEVADDGRGGADPAGAGLTGLARRVAALDGRLEVESPPGGPTVARAVIPCAS